MYSVRPSKSFLKEDREIIEALRSRVMHENGKQLKFQRVSNRGPTLVVLLNSTPPPLPHPSAAFYKPSKSIDLYHMAGWLVPELSAGQLWSSQGKLEGDNQGSILVPGNTHNFFWPLVFVARSLLLPGCLWLIAMLGYRCSIARRRRQDASSIWWLQQS